MKGTKDITELFKLDNDILKGYGFLGEYSKLIYQWLVSYELDNSQLIRYMFVGFFFDYRAANHKGESFNTIIKAEESKMEKLIKKHPDFFKKHNVVDNGFITKAKIFNQYFGREIKDTEDYLSLLHLKELSNINGEVIFNYVVKGIYDD